MIIWKLIDITFNAMYILAYTSMALWVIAAIVNIVRYIKNKKNKKKNRR